MASTYLSRTPASSGNRKTWTFSAWVKRGNLSSNQNFGINQQDVANNNIMVFTLGTNNKLDIYDYNGAVSAQLITNRVFTDTSAWYHIVVAVDTTNATADDRMKIYVNGVQETSFSSRTNPSLNYDFNLNQSGKLHVIGAYAISSIVNYFDGQMAHVHFIDGTAYDASAFGETDATTEIWKPKTAPSVTYGTNGFFLKFENSGSMGTDSSGNGNNFTVNGTLTQTIDTPSNVFATLNPLNVPALNQPTFSNGNLTSTSSSSASGSFGGSSSIGVSKGKWYIEAKAGAIVSSNVMNIGVTYNPSETARTNNDAKTDYEYTYNGSGNKSNNNTDSAYGDSYTTGDIIGIALDLDNNKIWWSKNGTFQNSGDPVAGTGEAFTLTSGETYFFYHQDETGASSNTSTFEFNFGNGYFGVTPVASAQNPDDGIGIFEYAVPTGYKALCTKSINAQEYS